MKWYKRKHGTKRTVRKFAFFPISLEGTQASRQRIWLEFYYEEQTYRIVDLGLLLYVEGWETDRRFQ